MKLYTEEQVRAIILKSRLTDLTTDSLMLFETPIELPSDEEIRERAENCGEDDSLSPADEYENGAKWMKEKILNQNK